MQTKEITITLQPVSADEQPKEVKLKLAYCYATEIGYKNRSDEDITDFTAEAIEAIRQNKMPDINKSIRLVLSALIAYSDFTGTEPPVTGKQLMYQLSPKDLGLSIGTILGLRSQFYHVPGGEPEDKSKEEDSEKKA